MSDDPTLPEGNSGEAASAAEGSPPPWGDDFNPERAWRTIEHLRGRERELESDAKAYKRLQEDEDAQREWLAQQGYEIADDAEEEDLDYDDNEYGDSDEDDPYDQRLSQLERHAQEQAARAEQEQANRAIDEFQTHLGELSADLGEQGLSQREIKQIFYESMDNGFTPQATEAAYKELLKEREEYEKRVIENYRQSKRTPHVPASGQSATQAPNLDDPRQRHQWMQERVAALEND